MGELKLRGRIWWVRYYRNGRRYEESARTAKKTEAERVLRLREGDIAKGIPVSPAIGRFTFDDAAKDLLNEYAANRRSSKSRVEGKIRLHLAPYFGGRRMASITTADVRAFTAERLEAKAKPAEVNRELAALKRMYSLAVQGGRLLHRPHIPMLREDNARQGFFEREQFEAVARHLPDDIRDVVAFAYVTGWRIPSEVLTLEWRQVDMKAGTVRLEPGTTKNREGRTFPLTGDLRSVLERRQTLRKELQARDVVTPFVFHREGRPVRAFGDAWKSACKAAGTPGRIPHDLRRTAVRNMVRAGVPERVAMQLTGHRTRSVFERYNIVSESDLTDAARRLERHAG